MARRLFLERRTYQQNRLQDAARLLPILGLILIFGPIFIRSEDFISADEAGTPDIAAGLGGPTQGSELIYYFVIWLGLIALTALVNRSLMRTGSADRDGAASARNETDA